MIGRLPLAGLALLSAVAGAAPARGQATEPPAAAAEEENSGQDPTRPLARIDVRMKYANDTGGVDAETLTLRADKPFLLGGGWKLNTRIDLPLVVNDAVSLDNPDGSHEFGLSDVLLQALVIAPSAGPWTFAFGTQLIIPTGTQDQFTTGKWQLVPTVAAVRQLPQISRGSFAALIVRDSFSIAGSDDRADSNVFSVSPTLNIALPNRWFVTFGPEIKFNTRDDWRVFVPFDMTVGARVGRNMVVSLQGDVALVDDFPQYDWQVELRIGFFL